MIRAHQRPEDRFKGEIHGILMGEFCFGGELRRLKCDVMYTKKKVTLGRRDVNGSVGINAIK